MAKLTTAQRRVRTAKRRYGKDYYSVIGARGGSARVPKGAAMLSAEERKQRASAAGKLSKRGPAREKTFEEQERSWFKQLDRLIGDVA